MCAAIISGSGYYVPHDTISNEELVNSFNTYVEKANAKASIAIKKSSSDFIESASGIKQRHVIDKTGILDVNNMCPNIAARTDGELSLQAEMSVKAAKMALRAANKKSSDIDAIIIACSNMQRAYPAISIETQNALNIKGWGLDLNVACSSAVFGITMSLGAIEANHAKTVLIISPEIYTGHLNFRDRRSHFIFGDAASAVVIENRDQHASNNSFAIIDCKLQTKFSNSIRNNFGFLNHCIHQTKSDHYNERLFMQNGKKVVEEVVPLVAFHISERLNTLNINPANVKRLWLHQSNINMNKRIAELIYGREATDDEIPHTLGKFGNTGAAGSIMAFNQNNKDLVSGDYCVLCAYGAGYAVGSIILQKI